MATSRFWVRSSGSLVRASAAQTSSPSPSSWSSMFAQIPCTLPPSSRHSKQIERRGRFARPASHPGAPVEAWAMVTSTCCGMSDDTPESSSLCAGQPAGTEKAQPRAAAAGSSANRLSGVVRIGAGQRPDQRARVAGVARDRHRQAIGAGREQQQLAGERAILLAVDRSRGGRAAARRGRRSMRSAPS